MRIFGNFRKIDRLARLEPKSGMEGVGERRFGGAGEVVDLWRVGLRGEGNVERCG